MSTQVVSSGGVQGTFTAGQTLDVISSGVGDGFVLDAGAVANVSSGGVAYGTDVEGGTIFIGASGETDGNQVRGGSEVVLAGGEALSTTVFAGGSSIISAGGSAFDTVLDSGKQYVLGSAGGTVLYVDATQIVGNGGTIEGTGVGDGSVVIVQSGGVASDVTIGNPAAPDVGVAAFVPGVAGKELLVVLSGGSASDTQLGVNGLLVVLSGGSATGTNAAGGSSISGNAVILETAAGPIGEGNSANGLSVAAGQSLLVFSGGTATDTTLSGGTEMVASGGSASGFTDFAAGGTLVLSGTALPGGTISGFAVGDEINLAGIALTSAGVPNFDSATGLLTITEGGSAYHLTFDTTHDSYAGEAFSAGNDGNGDTEITLFTCFCAGTRIAIPGGTVAVENLRSGDLVHLADGSIRPVRWLGRQTVSRRFADPLRALPVRIRAGALGNGLPERDLLLSPGHAVRLDGLLVNAGALVGLPGIAREAAAPQVFNYWHVELDAHALLLAEGVAAESYLDGAEPAVFDNAAERPAREPAPALKLPRVQSARQLPAALRDRLGPRAAA